jgi:hypothetical protein
MNLFVENLFFRFLHADHFLFFSDLQCEFPCLILEHYMILVMTLHQSLIFSFLRLQLTNIVLCLLKLNIELAKLFFNIAMAPQPANLPFETFLKAHNIFVLFLKILVKFELMSLLIFQSHDFLNVVRAI